MDWSDFLAPSTETGGKIVSPGFSKGLFGLDKPPQEAASGTASLETPNASPLLETHPPFVVQSLVRRRIRLAEPQGRRTKRIPWIHSLHRCRTRRTREKSSRDPNSCHWNPLDPLPRKEAELSRCRVRHNGSAGAEQWFRWSRTKDPLSIRIPWMLSMQRQPRGEHRTLSM